MQMMGIHNVHFDVSFSICVEMRPGLNERGKVVPMPFCGEVHQLVLLTGHRVPEGTFELETLKDLKLTHRNDKWEVGCK